MIDLDRGLLNRSVQVCPFYFTCIFYNIFVYLHHNQRFNNNIILAKMKRKTPSID